MIIEPALPAQLGGRCKMSLKPLNTRRKVEASENLGFQNSREILLRRSRRGSGVALGRWHYSTMKTLHVLGLYFLMFTVALLVWSVWRVKNGFEHADFSFVILVPVALGLICYKRWAIWSSVVLGSTSSFLVVGIAVTHSLFHMNGLELGFGPFQISNPSVAAIWIFTLIYVLIIGTPMMIAMIFRKNTRL